MEGLVITMGFCELPFVCNGNMSNSSSGAVKSEEISSDNTIHVFRGENNEEKDNQDKAKWNKERNANIGKWLRVVLQ